MRYRSAQKPDKCPKCGSGRISDIMYGYPRFTDELQKDINEGKVVLGGCCVSGDDPVWKCGDCGADIKKIKRVRKRK